MESQTLTKSSVMEEIDRIINYKAHDIVEHLARNPYTFRDEAEVMVKSLCYEVLNTYNTTQKLPIIKA